MSKLFLLAALVVTIMLPTSYGLTASQTYTISVTIPEQVTMASSLNDTHSTFILQSQQVVRDNQTVQVRTMVVP